MTSRKRHTLVDQIYRVRFAKGPPRTLLFGTHCQELCASAKGALEFGDYASVTEFLDDSECLLRENSESVGTGKTHGLCGGRALRKCSEKRCRSANNVLFNH